MRKELVSIVIPTFNRGHLLGQALDSILEQTYSNWECLVVDDGSEDYTEELMEFYCSRDTRIHFYHRPKNRLPGGNAARNYGFERSKGELIQWFDSDNLMLPEKIRLKVEQFQKQGVDIVVCENEEILSVNPFRVEKKWPIRKPGNELFNHLIGRISFDTNGPMFRREYLKDKSLFRESMFIGQDWEFFSRLLVFRPSIYYLNKVLYRLRTLEDGIRSNQDRLKIYSKAEGELALFRLIKKADPFEESGDKTVYQKMVFYRILSRYQFIRKEFSLSAAIKYLRKALPLVEKKFLIIGLKKSFRKPLNFRNLFRILVKK